MHIRQDSISPLDDGVVTDTLPFAFSFYGASYSALHISTNGNVHFGPPNDYFTNSTGYCLPNNSQYVPQAMVAPLWFDFVVPDSAGGGGGVYTSLVGTAPARTYIVEWRDVYEYSAPSSRATFELMLSENGVMTFQYASLAGPDVSGSEGVIGIQNADGTVGLQYSCYQDVLTPGRAIRYQLPQAVVLTPDSARKGGAPGATVTYTETLANRTGINNSFDIRASGNTWTTTVQPANTGQVGVGSSVGITVQVQIPPGTPLGARDVVTITASSSAPQRGAFTATAVLTTSASTHGVDFAPSQQTRAGDYGSALTYTVALVNRSGQTNSFTIDAQGNQWQTHVSPSRTGDLPPDASTPLTVAVNVPGSATLGARDVVTVTARGQQPSPGQYFGVTTITTTAGIWRQKSNMPAPRSRAAAVLFPRNGRVYVLGGA
ncbi:MAG: hypothetical protein M3021_03540, partial [Actinomycetota bacterium]|nr:hypothetical protein [Actinomycetota bacterium]